MLGDSRIPMQVDIGIGAAIGLAVETVTFPTLLGGAAPRIRAYPIEAVVAEKMHAMVALGEGNSRMKDFHDVFMLAQRLAFDGRRLVGAVAATFARRRTPWTPDVPVALTEPFYRDQSRRRMWRGYTAKVRTSAALPEFPEVGDSVRAFLGPLRRSAMRGGAFERAWRPGGPWR